MPPIYSPFWKPFEILGRVGLVRRKLDLGDLTLGAPDAMDVTGDAQWRDAADARKLHDLWGPPQSSAWSGYHRPTLFAALDSIPSARVFPAAPPGLDAASAPRQLPSWFGPRTAVILDVPGDAAVAYGALLCLRGGYAPVATFNNWPHARGVIPVHRALAALLHYSPWAREGWDRIEDKDAAPPVFLADSARIGAANVKPRDFDNRYYLLETDLPSGATLAARGIETLVYVHDPGDVPPESDDLNGYLHEAAKRVRVQHASVSFVSWGFHEPAPLDVAIRKTPFTTTRDPAFRGYRRNAAGGFGVLVPEPSSGGG